MGALILIDIFVKNKHQCSFSVTKIIRLTFVQGVLLSVGQCVTDLKKRQSLRLASLLSENVSGEVNMIPTLKKLVLVGGGQAQTHSLLPQKL